MKKKKRIKATSANAEPVHQWFGLTYTNYLVLPRAVLQSMPPEWQEKFVKLLEEADAACEHAKVPTPHGYRVHPVNGKGRYVTDEVPHYRRAQNLFTEH